MKFIYSFFFILFSLGTIAQTDPVAKGYITKGEQEYRNGNYEAAANNFKAAVTKLKADRTPIREYAAYEKREEEANQLANLKKNADKLFSNAKTVTDYENAKKGYTEIINKNNADSNARQRINECNTKINQMNFQARENNSWNTAIRENSVDAFKKYLNEFPEGSHKNEALTRINNITLTKQKEQENLSWRNALQRNTISAFEEYLANYPEGSFRAEASSKINEIKIKQKNEQEELLWKKALELNTLEGYQSYLVNTNAGKYKSTASTKIVELEDVALWEKAKRINTVDSYFNYLDNDNNSVKKFATEATVLIEETYAKQAFEEGNYELAVEHLSKIRKIQRFTDFQQNLLKECHEEIDYTKFITNPTRTAGKIFLESYPNSKYREKVQRKYDELIRTTTNYTPRQPIRNNNITPRRYDRVSLILAGHIEFLDIIAYGATTGLKIGSFDNPVNLTIEAGYKQTNPGVDNNNVKNDGITLNQAIGSAVIKFNVGGKNFNDKFICGIGGEYNYTFGSYYQLDNASIKVNDINIRYEHSVSGMALIGWGFHNGAFNLYYKYDIISPYNSQYIQSKLGEYDDLVKQANSRSRIGLSLVFYLHK